MNKHIHLSVIVPAYNESRRIEASLRYMTHFLHKQPYVSEIIVVDDGSTDGTTATVKQLNIPHLTVVRYPHNRGKGFAVNYGASRTRGTYLLFCDADNATPFEQVSRLLAVSEKDHADVVIGSRHLSQSAILVHQSLSRKIAARFSNLLIQIVLLPGIRDTQCGFKLFSRAAADVIFERQTIWGWGFDFEILYIARLRGFTICEVPVKWMSKAGSKLQSPLVYVNTLLELVKIKIKSLKDTYH